MYVYVRVRRPIVCVPCWHPSGAFNTYTGIAHAHSSYGRLPTTPRCLSGAARQHREYSAEGFASGPLWRRRLELSETVCSPAELAEPPHAGPWPPQHPACARVAPGGCAAGPCLPAARQGPGLSSPTSRPCWCGRCCLAQGWIVARSPTPSEKRRLQTTRRRPTRSSRRPSSGLPRRLAAAAPAQHADVWRASRWRCAHHALLLRLIITGTLATLEECKRRVVALLL